MSRSLSSPRNRRPELEAVDGLLLHEGALVGGRFQALVGRDAVVDLVEREEAARYPSWLLAGDAERARVSRRRDRERDLLEERVVASTRARVSDGSPIMWKTRAVSGRSK